MTKLVIVLAMIPLAIWLRALTYAALWGWFAVPLGAPTVSMAHAYGLAILARAFTMTATDFDTEGGGLGRAFAYSIVAPLLSLGVGYAIVHWIGI